MLAGDRGGTLTESGNAEPGCVHKDFRISLLILSISSLQWFKGQPWPHPEGLRPLAYGGPHRLA